jgi:hypothetical protein
MRLLSRSLSLEFHGEETALSSVKVGENHVVLGYGRERPMY